MKRWTLFLGALIALSHWLIACGNSNKSDRSGGGGGVANPCPTCIGQAGVPPGTAKIFEATTQHGGSFPFEFALAVFGTQQVVNPMYGGGYYQSVANYRGTIYINGALNVFSNSYAGNCVIPAGQYTIASAQPGQMGGGAFAVTQFELTNGSIRLQASLQNGGIRDFNGDGIPDSFYGSLYILSGPGYYNNGFTNCGDVGTWFGGY